EYAGPLSAMWRQLPDALRRSSAWRAPDVFGEVARDDARRAGHHRMLQSYARHDYAEVWQALRLRGDELLCFEHPHAGWQLPKGGIEPGERPEDAVLRELAEETGVARVERVTPLGWWTVANGTVIQTWHGFALDLPADLPDRWTHVATGSPEEEGLRLVCRFTPLDENVRAIFAPLFHEGIVRALESRGRFLSAV
ncbi:MAG: NUDIX domain-containing protein, partial [Myxococcales bacterium]|nr:NUDIX domain-containing protein [Myxococcales bacterium]